MQNSKEGNRGTFKCDGRDSARGGSQTTILERLHRREHWDLPAGAIGSLRSIQQEGDVIDGHAVPGDTPFLSSRVAHNAQETNFRDADPFIPEHRINDEYHSNNKPSSRPFSLGPRGRIGKDLSYLKMRLVVAKMVWLFSFVVRRPIRSRSMA
jgi:cytochrome P450